MCKKIELLNHGREKNYPSVNNGNSFLVSDFPVYNLGPGNVQLIFINALYRGKIR